MSDNVIDLDEKRKQKKIVQSILNYIPDYHEKLYRDFLRDRNNKAMAHIIETNPNFAFINLTREEW